MRLPGDKLDIPDRRYWLVLAVTNMFLFPLLSIPHYLSDWQWVDIAWYSWVLVFFLGFGVYSVDIWWHNRRNPRIYWIPVATLVGTFVAAFILVLITK